MTEVSGRSSKKVQHTCSKFEAKGLRKNVDFDWRLVEVRTASGAFLVGLTDAG